MKKLLLTLLALCLLFVACAPDESCAPASPYDTFTPMLLPSAAQVADFATVPATSPHLDAAEIDAEVAAAIEKQLMRFRIPVTEPITATHEVHVRYLATLREPLTERELADGVLKDSLVGEATILAADAATLFGHVSGDTEILLDRHGPDLFGLTNYKNHTFLYHVDICAVYRAPKTLAELPNPENALGMDVDRYHASIRQEIVGAHLWDAWLATISVSAPPQALVGTIHNDYIAAYQARHAVSGSALSFDAWLAAHTTYRDTVALELAADIYAEKTARKLLAACTIADSVLHARTELPDYDSAALALAQAEGLSSARYWTLQQNGSAAGWILILRNFCAPRLAATYNP